MQEKNIDLIIIGAGPAGYTAAIYAGRAGLNVVQFRGSKSGGQLLETTKIDNYPGFSDGISGFELAERMSKQAARFGVKFIDKAAVEVNCKEYSVKDSNENLYQAKALILATGCSKRLFGVSGEDELFGYGVSTCATCDGMFYKDKSVAVIGANQHALEEAIFLTRFATKVFLITEQNSDFLFDYEKKDNLEIITKKSLIKICGTKQVGVQAIELKSLIDDELTNLSVAGVFIAVPFRPNSELVRGQVELNKNGYVIAKPDSSKTSSKGVFVCGDLRAKTLHQVSSAVGSASLAASEAIRFINRM